MKTVKEVINNLGEKVTEYIGEGAIKLSEQSMQKCIFFAIYEPKVPQEMLDQRDE